MLEGVGVVLEQLGTCWSVLEVGIEWRVLEWLGRVLEWLGVVWNGLE